MKSSLVLALAWGLLICSRLSSICEGEDKIGEGQKTSQAKAPTMVVNLDKAGDVRKLLDGRTTAIYDCIRVINEPEDRSSFKAFGKRDFAFYLLGVLQASDHPEAVELLVKNVDYFFLIHMSLDYPLLGYSAAKAIVKIGSPALKELLKSLESEQTDNKLRLVAFIIERVDGRELGQCRIDLEIKRVLANNPDLRDAPNAHLNNLRQLQKWFSDAEFFTTKDNWPGRSRTIKKTPQR